MIKNKEFTLRLLIGALVMSSVLMTAIVSSVTAVNSMKESLTLNYLENNWQYAEKIASDTNILLTAMQNKINFIAQSAGNQKITQKEMDFFLEVNKNQFNSIVIEDENRIIQTISPSTTGLKVGTQLNSDVSKLAVALKEPFISEPYVAESGRLIIMITAPIFNDNGEYEGFVGGTIYLEAENVLSNMLNAHFYNNGSYVYVIDKHGHLIFHPNKNRINELVLNNDAINHVREGKRGYIEAKNSKGIDFFMGYAPEEQSGWGFVSQTPTSVLEGPLKKLVIQMMVQALPIFVLILLVVLWVSYIISKPLHRLAKISENAISGNRKSTIEIPDIHSNIYEVRQLTLHINKHLNVLNHENQLDHLTGLANRKTFELIVQEWIEKDLSFSLILIDIDHFKQVNDTYGHLAGDEVLRFLARTMESIIRKEDVCFRYGGEEFGILVKYSDADVSYQIAERLRNEIERRYAITGEAITISIGVSIYKSEMQSYNELIKSADKALYQSKSMGRNVTTMYTKEKNK